MEITSTKKRPSLLAFMLLGTILLGQTYCASKQMPPARVIPPGDDNTRLCKQSYLLCRSECSTVKHKATRLKCADQCERDADSCLLQSRGSKEK